MSRSLARDWWGEAVKRAGLEPKRGRGWHSLRRKFASGLMDLPLEVLCELGGWKTAETVLQCYQKADEGRTPRIPQVRSGRPDSNRRPPAPKAPINSVICWRELS